ncbi:MAG: SPFH domain-containing protein [Dehalococcoidia bacterium]|nr:SPFH domain-containing protein [Dehalococcoidia bacterium]
MHGGFRGPQIDLLRPGTYRVNTLAFSVEIVGATVIPENSLGVVVAEGGIPLTSGYIIAPRPVGADGQPILDPGIFQDGQKFINSQGYRGPQLDTLQPGIYYINPKLFGVKIIPVMQIAPGYVAVIRSNVGIELEEPTGRPGTVAGKGSDDLKGPVHDEIERLLISDKYVRGIWRVPIAPGTYNLNTFAFTPYLVPTSAVTIDWASAGKIGTEVKGVTDQGVLYKFDPLKVTSKDGFLLEVNVRMIIRITPENAAYIIARFGSVDNLIDQIVHPLIDSSFWNKAGEKKAIDFFQSRTSLQTEALEHARSVFESYSVEAQNLLVAYIQIPDQLLATQTLREIALQQQAQFKEQANANEESIQVQEKAARAAKQTDVVNAELEIIIKDNLAQARMKEAEGEATYIQKTNAAAGIGLAEGYQRQKEALGEQGTTLVNVITALAAKGIPIVPTTVVGGGDSGISGLIGTLAAKYGKELSSDKPEAKP